MCEGKNVGIQKCNTITWKCETTSTEKCVSRCDGVTLVSSSCKVGRKAGTANCKKDRTNCRKKVTSSCSEKGNKFRIGICDKDKLMCSTRTINYGMTVCDGDVLVSGRVCTQGGKPGARCTRGTQVN